jgi:predicted DNA binding protein
MGGSGFLSLRRVRMVRMLWLHFRVRQTYDFDALSRAYPRATLSNWCNYDTDVLEIYNPDPDAWPGIEAALRQSARRGFRLLDAGAPTGDRRIVLTRCGHPKELAVTGLLDQHDCLVLHPIVYRDGWKTYRAIAMDEKRVASFFRALGKVAAFEVLGRRRLERPLFRETYLLPAVDLFSRLTAKQVHALLLAVEHGYYEVPRRTSFEKIAKAAKVPKTTLEEQVRRAENNLVRLVAPLLAAAKARP